MALLPIRLISYLPPPDSVTHGQALYLNIMNLLNLNKRYIVRTLLKQEFFIVILRKVFMAGYYSVFDKDSQTPNCSFGEYLDVLRKHYR